jgi:hypothetical protein
VNRTELQRLAEIRIEEAITLEAAGKFDGAYYLAGYAIECALKACIAKMTAQDDFPPQDTKRTHYVHDATVLLRTAGLETALSMEMGKNPAFKLAWSQVIAWSESSRYQFKTQVESSAIINAVVDTQNGILPWLRQRW